LQDNLWYWRVRAFRNNENGAWSEVWKFRIDRAPPAPPTPISPLEGENTNDNTPTFKWSSIDENSLPVLYYIAVSDNQDFPYENASSGWIADNQWTPTQELPDGIWYWRVRAKDNAGNEGENSTTLSFRIDTVKPPAPTLIWPPDGGWTNTTPNLDWSPVTEENSFPIKYYVQISKVPTFSPLYTTSGWITDDNWRTPPLGEATYYWRVQAMDNAGNIGSFSTSRSFQVDNEPPSKVQLMTPENGAFLPAGVITFTWTQASDNNKSGVARYWIQIDNEPTFTPPLVHENDNVPDNSYAFTLTSAGTYYWRVCAIDAVGNIGAWAENMFTTSGWRQVESWSAAIQTFAMWYSIEEWSTTITTAGMWQSVESWTATASTAAGWLLVESWQASIITSLAWSQVEIWTAVISTTAEGRLIENWQATVKTTVIWSPIETWSAAVTTSGAWKSVESWTAAIGTISVWRLTESWAGTIVATTQWRLVESWTATLKTTALWSSVESWTTIITAIIPAPIPIYPPYGEN
ncbi:MAG: Ig-like domain-containing protein, partial [Candidatus Hadarchaeales archaeon]